MSIIGNPIMAGGGGPTASIKVTGLSQSDTVTAAMGSKTKTAKWVTFTNPAAHGLPSGYTELESIESTGTQYIDTGVNVDNNLGVEMDFVCKSAISTTDGEFGSFFGGCKLLNGSLNIRVWIGTYKTGSYAGVFDWNLTTYNGGISVGTRMQLSLRNGTYTTSNGVSVTLPAATFDAAQNAYLFAANRGGTSYEHAKVLLYACKVYSGDTLARNFIPAKRNSDGAIGLYDLVTDAFFPNSGTGVFTAGAEIQSSVRYWLIDGIRDFGTWTVTATNGTQTATRDVLVDVITEYEITMSYRLYLYNEGDECEDVTDGWDRTATSNLAYSLIGVTKQATYLQLSYVNNIQNPCAYAYISKAVNVSAFSRLAADVEFSGNNPQPDHWSRVNILLADDGTNPNVPSTYGGTVSYRVLGKDTDYNESYVGEVSVDLSEVSGNKFVGLAMYYDWVGESATATLKIKRVWLE